MLLQNRLYAWEDLACCHKVSSLELIATPKVEMVLSTSFTHFKPQCL